MRHSKSIFMLRITFIPHVNLSFHFSVSIHLPLSPRIPFFIRKKWNFCFCINVKYCSAIFEWSLYSNFEKTRKFYETFCNWDSMYQYYKCESILIYFIFTNNRIYVLIINDRSIGYDKYIRRRAYRSLFSWLRFRQNAIGKNLPLIWIVGTWNERDLKIVWKHQHDCSRSKMAMKFMKIFTNR